MIGRLVLVGLMVAVAAWYRRGRPRTAPAVHPDTVAWETTQQRRARIFGHPQPIWGRKIVADQGGVYWSAGQGDTEVPTGLTVDRLWVTGPRKAGKRLEGVKVRFAR